MGFLLSSWKASAKFRFGVTALALLVIIALLSPLVYRPIIGTSAPATPGNWAPWEPASAQHPLGTDAGGRDVLTNYLAGLQATLTIGFLAGFIGTAIGIVVGFLAGYKGGPIDTTLTGFANILLVIPSYPVLVSLSLVMTKKSAFSLAVILAIFSWPLAARTIRAQVLSMREQAYIDMARVSRQGDMRIIFTEIMPNLLPYLIMGFAFSTIGAMVGEVGLALVGLGPSDMITLGLLINNAQSASVISRGMPGMLLIPVGVLIIIFVAITMINRGLEEHLNPRLQNVTGK
jgi:peptide/nickel transport system permease protein